MDHKASNILEGEASESDEEVSDYPGFMRTMSSPAPHQEHSKPGVAQNDGPSSSVVVMGEASESENEEDEFILRRAFPSLDDKDIQELEIQVALESQRRPKFETPFHKKLYERNFTFRLGVVESQLERYNHVIDRLQLFIPHANNSQTHVQEALRGYRNLSDSTKQLNDQLENVLLTTHLPKIRIPASMK